MQLIRGLHNLTDSQAGTVLTIGNFDGIHRGHQAILTRLRQCAHDHQLPSTVMFFEPHPEEVFRPDQAPARLSRCRDKVEYLRSFGIDQVIVVKFNRDFSKMTAEEFLKNILIRQLGVKYLIVGDDFHFGYKRQGNFEYLSRHQDEFDFGLEQTPTLSNSEQRISSTYVRKALAENDLVTAEKLLGRPYSIAGKVFHGDKRGRTIGFPTANILLHRKNSPVNGVYAVEVRLKNQPGNQVHYGVANLGKRPTVGSERFQLEVHIFDWSEDIYSQTIEVKFIKFIRGEKKFDNFAALKHQIDSDATEAREFFNL